MINIVKKIIYAALISATVLMCNVYADEFDWAADAVEYCQENDILAGNEHGDLLLGDNLTREQMAKLLIESFDIVIDETVMQTNFSDIPEERWSIPYISVFEQYMKVKDEEFRPEEYVTREEFISSIVLVSGLKEGNIRNRTILDENFEDYNNVSKNYKILMSIAVERGYVKGFEGKIRPKDLLNRAEACTVLHRILLSREGKLTLDLGVIQTETKMINASQVPVEQAIQWAKNNKAAQIFIDAAPIYWKYGELTGLRPELLYAQAAKETGYGRYGGAVVPEQNNWAGIKTATATGDETYDHESFETPDDGIRAHFNHMSAYVGLEPIGEPHGRYFSVSKIAWAGTVKTLEELGGKWCPDLYYGYSILHNYIEPMIATEYTPLSEQMRQELFENTLSDEKFDLGE